MVDFRKTDSPDKTPLSHRELYYLTRKRFLILLFRFEFHLFYIKYTSIMYIRTYTYKECTVGARAQKK